VKILLFWEGVFSDAVKNVPNKKSQLGKIQLGEKE